MIRAGWAALVLGWRAAPGCGAARVLLALLAAGGPVLAAWASKLLVDELSLGSDGQFSRVATLAVLSAGIGVLVLVLSQLMNYVTARHEAAVTLRAESDLFRRVCAFVGLRYFENPDFQNKLLLAEGSAADGPTAAISFAQNMVRSIASLVGFLGMVAIIWPAMAVVLLVAALPGLVAEIRLSSRHVEGDRRVTPLERRRIFYRTLLTDHAAAKEVRLFGLGDFFRSRQLEALHGSQKIMVRLAGRTAVVQSGLSLLGAVIAGVGVVFVARRVIAGTLTPGDVLLFIAAVGGVQSALSQMVGEIGMASRSLTLFQGYLDVMRSAPDLPIGERPAPPLRDALRFEDVWFRYTENGPWILRGVSFELPAGTSLGLVGVNGAGKSTLVKLICRFYDPDRGRILWDGTDLRELSPESLRGRLAATFQDFMAYDLTAAENVGVGRLARRDDLDAIRRCAARTDIHEAIERLPLGYDTLLSRMYVDEERQRDFGVTLSGGQWQRIAIARSLFRDNADLLILDEPSSNLDADAEHQVHRALQELRRGRTSLLISHRLGSVREADHIVVLDGGRITERGHHDQLMRAGGTYARLFTKQARGYHGVDRQAELLDGTVR